MRAAFPGAGTTIRSANKKESSGYGGSAADGVVRGGFAGQAGQDVLADGLGGTAVGRYGERGDPGVQLEPALVDRGQVGAGEQRAARGAAHAVQGLPLPAREVNPPGRLAPPVVPPWLRRA